MCVWGRRAEGERREVRESVCVCVCVNEWNGKGEIVNDHNRHGTLCLGRERGTCEWNSHDASKQGKN